MSGKKSSYQFTTPVLTAELLREILSGRAVIDPALAEALHEAEIYGTFTCPYCHGLNDRILRVKSCGMGVESIAHFLEILTNPQRRDFCLCQCLILTMETGDEYADTIENMRRYILPLYRYYRLRFVEIARGGELEDEGIVILQDTRYPERLYGEGFYKLSEHLMRNGTVAQVGSQRLCSVKFKGFCGDYWLNNCLGLSECYHLFGYNAAETDRVADSQIAIKQQNQAALKKSQRSRKDTRPPRIRLRISGESRDNYELAEISYIRENETSDEEMAKADLTVYMTFGFNSQETERADDTAQYDRAQRTTLMGVLDHKTSSVRISSRRALRRVGVFPLVEWGWSRLKCLLSIYQHLGVKWQKSCCVQCPFNKEASKCTPQGLARSQRHPKFIARGLLIEFGSLCLNERGTLYARKSLQTVVTNSRQREALAIFEETLGQIAFSLFEVKRIYTQKAKAARSVIRLASGTRTEMNRLFEEELNRLSLMRRTVHGIDYGVFAERGETYPTVEGFLVVAPAHIIEKVRGEYSAFEEKFEKVAHDCGITLPALPGTMLVQERKLQGNLFDHRQAA